MQRPTQSFCRERLTTPIGALLILTDGQDRARALDWEDHEARLHRLLRLHYGTGRARWRERASPSTALRALERYFAGDLAAIDSIAVETGGTRFQREVWAALRCIPAGRTLSYGALALQIGRRNAVRAVGAANGDNPVSIVVPCHRLIGADASLTGYGGGLARKRWLLQHEGVRLAERRRAA